MIAGASAWTGPRACAAADCVPHASAQAAVLPASRGTVLGAAALWERFVGHLRSGQMREAYQCFSPASQAVFSFPEFCHHYNPLTAANEAVLTPIDDGQLRLNGDIAQLRFVSAGTSGEALEENGPDPGVLVSALLVREEGRWHLVASGREAVARTEAELRNLLRRLWYLDPVLAARHAGKALDFETIHREAGDLFREPAAALCAEFYRIALLDTPDGPTLAATPRREELRPFLCRGEWVRAGAADTAPPAPRPAAPATATPDNAGHDSLPELPPPLAEPVADAPAPRETAKKPDILERIFGPDHKRKRHERKKKTGALDSLFGDRTESSSPPPAEERTEKGGALALPPLPALDAPANAESPDGAEAPSAPALPPLPDLDAPDKETP